MFNNSSSSGSLAVWLPPIIRDHVKWVWPQYYLYMGVATMNHKYLGLPSLVIVSFAYSMNPLFVPGFLALSYM